MLNLDPAFKESLTKAALSLCWCWLIIRRDGAMIGFTSFDLDLVIDDVTYRGTTGFDPGAAQTSSGVDKVDSQNLKGILDASGISKAEIDSGIYDGAIVRRFIVDYQNLPSSLATFPPKHRELPTSYIGSKKLNNLGYELQTKDLIGLLENQIGVVTTKRCRNNLGDNDCRKDLTNFTHGLTVTAVIDRRVFSVDGDLPDNYFDLGRLQFTGGANTGLHLDVIFYSDNQIVLSIPAPFEIAIGDTLTAVAGCDGTERTCIVRFQNYRNFMGEPKVPTTDLDLNTPSRRA
ncbi:MAG: DUF2163 domain-containing protein [Cyanobacteria bacterium J06623_7]